MKVKIKGEKPTEKTVELELRRECQAVVLYINGTSAAYFHDRGEASLYMPDMIKAGFARIDLNGFKQ